MGMGKLRIGVLLAAILAGAISQGSRAAEPVVKSGDLVAVTGDSITEQRLYSVFIEDYLLMCSPVDKVRTMQFGWGGDTTWGFLKDKLVNDVERYHPDVMTTCFGMNDGGYWVLQPAVADHYRASTQAIIDSAKKEGVRSIILGSPGCVDTNSYRSGKEKADIYNVTLGQLSAIDKDLAEKNNLLFADVHTPMMSVMEKAKAKYGDHYNLVGGDGVHPGKGGHMVMAYVFLKAMGFDGDIGTFTVDLSAGTAQASEGHKVLSDSLKDGTVEIESSRYPFCLVGKPEDPNGTAGVTEFFPFNQDLNRLTLIVKNAPEGKLKVTWGKTSKEFTSAELAKGINLAAEFQDNPFSEQFAKVEAAVVQQQNFETQFIKNIVWNMPTLKGLADEADKPALDHIAENGGKKDLTLFQDAATLVTPVRHTITIEVVK